MLTSEQIKGLILQIARQQPIDQETALQLDPKTLRLLLEVVQQLRAQGLAGPHVRTPERLLRMYHLIKQRLAGQEAEPDADQIIQSLTPQARQQILGNEAVLARQSNAQAMVSAQKQMAALNRPGLM